MAFPWRKKRAPSLCERRRGSAFARVAFRFGEIATPSRKRAARSRDAAFGLRKAISRSRLAVFRSRKVVFCSRAAIFRSREAVFGSRKMAGGSPQATLNNTANEHKRTNMIRILILLALLVSPIIAHSQPMASKDTYDKAMAELKSAKDGYSRWCALNHAAKESLNQGRDADAKSFADELERLAPKYKKDWNYGNAVQDFNIVLGRLALKSGDVDAAKKRLLAAGHSTGSPQMDTFGPNMTLANDLLAKGEKTVVVEYFKLCKKFWEMHNGKLDTWTKDVEQGRVPDFGANLDY